MTPDPGVLRFRMSPGEMADRLGLQVDEGERLSVTRRFTRNGQSYREEFIVTIYPLQVR